MCALTVASTAACSSASSPAPASTAAGDAAGTTAAAGESGDKKEEQAPAGAVEYSFAVHHSGATSHPYQQGSEFWNEKLKEYSNGTMELDIYPSNQLAAGSKSIEGTAAGSIDILDRKSVV